MVASIPSSREVTCSSSTRAEASGHEKLTVIAGRVRVGCSLTSSRGMTLNPSNTKAAKTTIVEKEEKPRLYFVSGSMFQVPCFRFFAVPNLEPET